MPHRSFSPKFASSLDGVGQGSPLVRDIAWDRPIFRAPLLPNPRVIFDPLPFRTQFSTAVRQFRQLTRR